ncbi:hypothetical protein V5F44_05215 [Xanthobacter sp. V2C-8]|uniref:hypothetical protein n=1 Tax=Xanthobacter albus TaxID=3119929 RepID=UPI003728968C
MTRLVPQTIARSVLNVSPAHFLHANRHPPRLKTLQRHSKQPGSSSGTVLQGTTLNAQRQRRHHQTAFRRRFSISAGQQRAMRETNYDNIQKLWPASEPTDTLI